MSQPSAAVGKHAGFRTRKPAPATERPGVLAMRGQTLGLFSLGLGSAGALAPGAAANLVEAKAPRRAGLSLGCTPVHVLKTVTINLIVFVSGVYSGFVDTSPMGAVVNRAFTIRSGQCRAHRYSKPLLNRIELGQIDPRFVITHRLPLSEAAHGFELFHKMLDGCEKVVLKAA